MESGDEVRKVLQEILEVEREHLAEYRRVTSLSLELQQRAVARQEQFGRISRGVFLFVGLLVAALLTLLVFILVRWSRQLLGI
jgi:rubrerythrin